MMIRLLRKLTAFFYMLMLLAAGAALVLCGLFFWMVQDLPQIPESLEMLIQHPATEIYAASGERIMTMGEPEVIPLDQVSRHFIKAILATEDHRFWRHHGIDKIRLVKAIHATFFQQQVQGASTITQQLCKNLFFSLKRSYWRKIREILIALQVETKFSKTAILEAYVNQIPFGPKIKGVESAARAYFGKPASALDPAEASFLAGLPKSPSRYDPRRFFDRAKKRQRMVLQRMVATHHITSEQADEIFAQPVTIRDPVDDSNEGYFVQAVVRQLEARYGSESVYHGGLRVTTTLDPRLQSAAAQALSSGVRRVEKLMGASFRQAADSRWDEDRLQGALACVETRSGAVKALVGGANWRRSPFNRAIDAQRQPGSGFKPFVYYAAIEKLGMHPASVVIDRPFSMDIKGAARWTPQNFGKTHRGPMILKEALARSVNSIAAQLGAQLGPEAIIEVARKSGITSSLDKVYAISLGACAVSPLEMAASYATIGAGGVRHRPFFIWRVEDAMGRVLEEHLVTEKRVLNAANLYLLNDMMQAVIDRGTAASIRRLGFDLEAAGKTGTSDDYRDTWFTGYTPSLCASVWVGYDRPRALRDRKGKGITGGRAAAPIWADFMKKAHAGAPARKFVVPPGIYLQKVDPRYGEIVDRSDRKGVFVAQKFASTDPHAEAAALNANGIEEQTLKR